MIENLATATPTEVDTELAELDNELRTIARKRKAAVEALHDVAKSSTYHPGTWGRKSHYTYSMTEEQVIAAVTEAVAAAKTDTYDGPMSTYDLLYGRAQADLANIPAYDEQAAKIVRRVAALDAEYDRRPWSRFFLVTSSNGHIHSSMNCSTCRITTTYGWLPELSGRTEADAVDQLGPALCSVCFASAPVEHQGGKITKAKAAKLAA